MKIFHVNCAISGGGLEQYLAQLFDELKNSGHENILLYGEKSDSDILSSMVKTYYIKDITNFHCKDTIYKPKKTRQILEDEKPDIVYIHQVTNASLIDFLTESHPSLRFPHGFKLICPEGKNTLKTAGRICPYPGGLACAARSFRFKCMPRNPMIGLPLIHNLKKIAKIHRKRSRMVVASYFMKNALLCNGFQEDKVNVIPYFTYLPENNDEPYNGKPTILSLGRIVPEKGMHLLLSAFAKIKTEAALCIIGEGPELKIIKNVARQMNISHRVSLPGWLPHDQLGRLYRQCSLVAVPSIWPEPFGIVGIEAMAYKKPVVAFDIGGISEWLLDGENGFLVKPGNVSELSEKIEFVLDNQALAKKMGEKGRVMVKERFTPETHLKNLIKLFQQTINEFYAIKKER